MALSIYSASSVLLEFSETMRIHVPLVASLERGNFPPIDMAEPPHAFHYHYGQHMLAAAFGVLGGHAPHVSLFASNALCAALIAFYAWALAREASGPAGGWFAMVLLVAAGTLDWFSAGVHASNAAAWARLMNPLGKPFATGNVIIGSFAWRVHGNSMAWAMCCAALALDLITDGRRPRAVLAGAALAALAPANETLFCAVVAGIVALPFAQALVDRKLDGRRLAASTAAAAIGVAGVVVTGGVILSFLSSGDVTHQDRLMWNRAFGTVATWDFGAYFRDPGMRIPIVSLRFVQEAGLVPLGALVAGPLWLWRRRSLPSVWFLAGLAALAASTLITLRVHPGNMYRLVSVCVVLWAIPVGAALGEAVKSPGPRWRRRAILAAASGATLLAVSNWPLFHVGIAASRPAMRPWPPAEGARATDGRACEFLRDHTRFDERVLPIPVESWGVLASGQWTPTGSWAGARPRYREASRLAAASLDAALLDELGIEYLYVDEARAGAALAKIRALVGEGRLVEVHRDAERRTAIYRRVSAPKA
jgi:hypothetical protein